MNLRRQANWLVAALAFGATVLPFLVYCTGVLTIGPYSRGGAGVFYADFWGDVLRLRGAALVLLLGPATLVLLWRLLAAYAWRRSPEDPPAAPR